MTDKPTLDDRVQTATVNHRVRVAMLFGTFVWAVLAVAFWMTSTPKRWVPLLLAVAGGVGLYLALR